MSPLLCATLLGMVCYADSYLPSRPQSIWSFAGDKVLVGHASLESPGGKLYFGLELDFSEYSTAQKLRAWVINGKQRIEVPVEFRDTTTSVDKSRKWPTDITMRFDHYDAVLTGNVKAEGPVFGLVGEWKKRRGRDEWVSIPFRAGFSDAAAFESVSLSTEEAQRIAGRWAVKFATDNNPAVGVFEAQPDGAITGTFLTASGDFGYLAGEFRKDQLYLSSFDGSHAFLFKATLQADGTLAGDFWAGDKHHETWTAKRDGNASLPDPLGLVKVNESVRLADLKFPNVTGTRKSLADPEFAGKARIIQVFGSWCPNCHDEAAYLMELDAKYRARGLTIIGLAFELTGDEKRDAKQVQIYAERHKIKYPLLIAGTRDKEKAAAAFPLLERIEAFPTTIFLHGDGRVRAVHTGYSGPATGADHAKLRKEFEELIEELLREQSK